MKKRALAAAMCCLSVASVQSILVPTASAQTAASPTMADQYQVSFEEPGTPFGTLQDSERVPYSGLPEGAKLTILDENHLSGNYNGELYVGVYGTDRIWLQLFPRSRNLKKTASNTVKFLVEYPDGSSEVVTHTFTVHPAERFQYQPYVASSGLVVGKEALIKLEDFPSTAQIKVVDSPTGWNVSPKGAGLNILAPKAETGTITYKVTYSDNSSEIATAEFYAESAPTPEPTPQTPTPKPSDASETSSGSSSNSGIIGGVIAAIVALLAALGGAVYSGLIPGLKLPF